MSKQEKVQTQPERTTKIRTKKKQKPEPRSSLNNSDSYTHVQRQHRCMVLTKYHNIPTDFISSQQWVEANLAN
jgi:hypothetical protein